MKPEYHRLAGRIAAVAAGLRKVASDLRPT